MLRRPTLRGDSRRLAAITVLAILAAASVAAPAGAAVPATPSVSAWVVARQVGELNTPYTPAAKDQGNSEGGTNTITRTAIGFYTVRLGGLGTMDGNPQITPMSNQLRWCITEQWGLDGMDVLVFVACHGLADLWAPVDTKFALTFVAATGTHGSTTKRLAYFRSNGGPGGSIDVGYQFSSNGQAIGVTGTADGLYTVTIPGLGATGGNVQITPWGRMSSGEPSCTAIDWKPVGADEVIHIACRRDVQPADPNLTLLFTAKAGPSGFTTRPAAYLLANRPKASSYVPVATYRYNSAGKSMTVLRSGVGKYTVVLKGMPAGGAAIVTPAGNTTASCQLSGLGSVVPMKAIVRCFTVGGVPTDSRFSLAYTG